MGGAVRDLLEFANANAKRLGPCKAHKFVRIEESEVKHGKRWRCTACDGVIDWSAYYWFTKGQEHGRPDRPLDDPGQ